MALTLYDRHAAQLDELLTNLANTDPDEATQLQEGRQALLDFKALTTFEDLEQRADAAVKASIAKAMSGFAEHFASVAAQAEDVTSTFKAAAKLAKEGEEELLLNRLNSFLERATKTAEAAKEAINAVKDLGKLDPAQAQDAIAKIEAAFNAWKGVRDAVKS